MNGDEAVRARVNGRTAIFQKTVWQLSIGEFQVRCLNERAAGTFVVQARVEGAWSKDFIAAGQDPTELLQRVVGSSATKEIIRGMVKT